MLDRTGDEILADDMGVNAYSLFADLDSKQSWFEAALEMYGRDVVAAINGVLDLLDASSQEI